ncbi:MAG TPA: hypothetical protein VN809_16000 [Telmatospirillum sp.]|nr:hypothetical protein [Telmatospirillum sp.]
MPKVKERRFFARYPAVNLMIEIDGQMFEVEDISLGGLRLNGRANVRNSFFSFTLCPRESGAINRKAAVRGEAAVVALYDNAMALKFERANMPLMKLVVRQAANELGVEPYAVK